MKRILLLAAVWALNCGAVYRTETALTVDDRIPFDATLDAWEAVVGPLSHECKLRAAATTVAVVTCSDFKILCEQDCTWSCLASHDGHKTIMLNREHAGYDDRAHTNGVMHETLHLLYGCTHNGWTDFNHADPVVWMNTANALGKDMWQTVQGRAWSTVRKLGR